MTLIVTLPACAPPPTARTAATEPSADSGDPFATALAAALTAGLVTQPAAPVDVVAPVPTDAAAANADPEAAGDALVDEPTTSGTMSAMPAVKNLGRVLPFARPVPAGAGTAATNAGEAQPRETGAVSQPADGLAWQPVAATVSTPTAPTLASAEALAPLAPAGAVAVAVAGTIEPLRSSAEPTIDGVAAAWPTDGAVTIERVFRLSTAAHPVDRDASTAAAKAGVAPAPVPAREPAPASGRAQAAPAPAASPVVSVSTPSAPAPVAADAAQPSDGAVTIERVFRPSTVALPDVRDTRAAAADTGAAHAPASARAQAPAPTRTPAPPAPALERPVVTASTPSAPAPASADAPQPIEDAATIDQAPRRSAAARPDVRDTRAAAADTGAAHAPASARAQAPAPTRTPAPPAPALESPVVSASTQSAPAPVAADAPQPIEDAATTERVSRRSTAARSDVRDTRAAAADTGAAHAPASARAQAPAPTRTPAPPAPALERPVATAATPAAPTPAPADAPQRTDAPVTNERVFRLSTAPRPDVRGATAAATSAGLNSTQVPAPPATAQTGDAEPTEAFAPGDTLSSLIDRVVRRMRSARANEAPEPLGPATGPRAQAAPAATPQAGGGDTDALSTAEPHRAAARETRVSAPAGQPISWRPLARPATVDATATNADAADSAEAADTAGEWPPLRLIKTPPLHRGWNRAAWADARSARSADSRRVAAPADGPATPAEKASPPSSRPVEPATLPGPMLSTLTPSPERGTRATVEPIAEIAAAPAAIEPTPAPTPSTVTLRVGEGDGETTRVRVTLRGETVQTRIIAPDAPAAAQLNAASPELRSGLARHGLTDAGSNILAAPPSPTPERGATAAATPAADVVAGTTSSRGTDAPSDHHPSDSRKRGEETATDRPGQHGSRSQQRSKRERER